MLLSDVRTLTLLRICGHTTKAGRLGLKKSTHCGVVCSVVVNERLVTFNSCIQKNCPCSARAFHLNMDVLTGQPVLSYHGGPKQAYFNPYSENGGSIVAVAGDDFAVIASDSRLSSGYHIHTREQSKLFKLSNQCVLGSTGCWCDILTFTRFLEARMKMYLHEHHKLMSTPAVAQLIVTMLYNKRFFPYYISNILAGLDEEGKGCIYCYDPVGHSERVQYRAGGSSSALLQPLLDNQIGFKNMENMKPEPPTRERAVNIIKDVFISAAERDIYTGDSIIIHIIDKDGIKEDRLALRRD